MGQIALETALNELKQALLLPSLFFPVRSSLKQAAFIAFSFIKGRPGLVSLIPPSIKPRPRPAELEVVFHGGHGHTGNETATFTSAPTHRAHNPQGLLPGISEGK